jgi:hypothetical protein
MFKKSTGQGKMQNSCRPTGLMVLSAHTPSTHVLGSAPGVRSRGLLSRVATICGEPRVQRGACPKAEPWVNWVNTILESPRGRHELGKMVFALARGDPTARLSGLGSTPPEILVTEIKSQ